MENELHSQQPYSSLQRTAWLYNIEQGDPQTDTPVLHHVTHNTQRPLITRYESTDYVS